MGCQANPAHIGVGGPTTSWSSRAPQWRGGAALAAQLGVRTIDVAVGPATAFQVFTEEIDAWYVRGPYSWNEPTRAVGIRFEPGVGGRWLEVWNAASGEGFEMGRIPVWEPGARLVLTYRNVHLPPVPLTEIEVRFQAIEGGTRVTLEHRGWDRLPAEFRRAWLSRAWIALMKWFGEYIVGAKEAVMTSEAKRRTLTPYLCCKDAAAAIEFYKKVFGAVEVTRWTDDAGKIGHAEIQIGEAPIMLSDEFPDIGVLSPQSLGGSPVALHLYVEDVDRVAREAVAAGGKLLRPVADQSYGDRNCKLADPSGHVWMVATHKEDVSLEDLQKRVGGAYEVSQEGA